jgi:hypothetical protein
MEGGRTLYPHMYGDQGWYDYRPERYEPGVLELYYWSMKPRDRERVPDSDWLRFLEGRKPGYAESALRADFETIRRRVAAMRRDTTTPDTRLSDDPMAYNPATVAGLVRLTLGGLPPKHQGEVLQARVRYFDPIRRRTGLPEDVAALVEKLQDDTTILTMVNLNQAEPQTLIVQGGAYGEHLCEHAATKDGKTTIGSRAFRVSLAPGAGGRLTITMKRYALPPTLSQPWDGE